MRRERFYIDGEFTESVSGRWTPVENPGTGETFAEVPDGTVEDARRAIAAARKAFDSGPWPRLTPEERQAALLRVADVLDSRAEGLAETIRQDAGATRRVSTYMQVPGAIAVVRDAAARAGLLRAAGGVISDQPSFGHSELRREPVGVCALFVPFNFPLFVAGIKLAPALAMGNTVVLKPSPLAPLAVLELARACQEAGIPPGVVNVVAGGEAPSRELCVHPDVNLISFTGSTETGRKVMEAAAGTVKRLVLELGGKAPVVLLDDADLDLALRAALVSAFLHSGQICGSGTRLLIPRLRASEILERAATLAADYRLGPTEDLATDVGPLISEQQCRRVEGYVSEAVAAGARVVFGGKRADGRAGHYFEPTLLADTLPEMRVVQEEVFGPVLVVQTYDTDEEAVQLANDTIYGLSASVWGRDLSRARSIAARIQAGGVWINDWGVGCPPAPWGGLKQSGIGHEGGDSGVLEYTQVRHIYTSLDSSSQRAVFGLGCAKWTGA